MSLFKNLMCEDLVNMIYTAQQRICYIGSGMPVGIAKALCHKSHEVELVIAIDYSDYTIRSGLGDQESLDLLEKAKIPILHAKGYRIAILIVDEQGFTFVPTPLCIEEETTALINAMQLNATQIDDVLIRFSNKEVQRALAASQTEEDRKSIINKSQEQEKIDISPTCIEKVNKGLKENPRMKFDISRKINVFNSALQYVKVSLKGGEIKRKSIPVPEKLCGFGMPPYLKDKYKASCALFDEETYLFLTEVDRLKKEFENIKEKYIYSVGGNYGMVLRKRDKIAFCQCISDLEKKIAKTQENLRQIVEQSLEKIHDTLYNYYVTLVQKDPSEEVLKHIRRRGLFPINIRWECERYVKDKLRSTLPSVDKICNGLRIEYTFQDITYETLKDVNFINAVKNSKKFNDLFSVLSDDKVFKEWKAVNEASK